MGRGRGERPSPGSPKLGRGENEPRVPIGGSERPLAPPGGGTGTLRGAECGAFGPSRLPSAFPGFLRPFPASFGPSRLPSALPGSLRPFPASFGPSRLPSALLDFLRPFPAPFRLFPSPLGPSRPLRPFSTLFVPFRLSSCLLALARPFPPILGYFRPPSVLSVPRCRCHGRWSPLAARSVLPGPGGRAQRAPEPVRDGLRAGDLGSGAGRGRDAAAAAAGAERRPRGARPGRVHGPALRQPERAPGRVPAAAGAGRSVRRPHTRRCHPAAPRLLLRPPRRHRADAGTRSRPRGHRQRRQNRAAQGRRAGTPRDLCPPAAPVPGSRFCPRCPRAEPSGRGPRGREGPAGHLRGHATAGPAAAAAALLPPAGPTHCPSSKPITSRISPVIPPPLRTANHIPSFTVVPPRSQSPPAISRGGGASRCKQPRRAEDLKAPRPLKRPR